MRLGVADGKLCEPNTKGTLCVLLSITVSNINTLLKLFLFDELSS